MTYQSVCSHVSVNFKNFRAPHFFGKELSLSHQVKYLGVILDRKRTWKPHLDHKCNKAIAVFWQCHRIVGKTWSITAGIAHWLYIAIVRPMLVYAVVVWWPHVELSTARTMLEHIQHLACLAIAGFIRITSTAAMEILLGLPPLDLCIKNVAMTSCYRLKILGHWVQGSVPK